jgi:tripartite-type tricarboxylate transporter receptor subunit TctC
MKSVFVLAVLIASTFACPPLHAQTRWPEGPLTLVVPFVPGSMGDLISRMLSDDLRQRLGQPVIVENRPGAGGNVGAAAVAQARPDGHTLLVGATNNFVINQFLYTTMGFDPLKAFEPVSILVDVPSVIFVNTSLPAKTYRDFVASARSNAGKFNYGSPGAGTTPHLAAELINRADGLGMTHIPYKGAAQAVGALLANDVQFYLGGAGLGTQHIKAGKLRALAVSGASRLAVLPDVPTFGEVGLADIRAGNWWGVAAPKGTPPDVVEKASQALREALATPATQSRLRELGVVAVASRPAEAARQWSEEASYWQRALKDMRVSID